MFEILWKGVKGFLAIVGAIVTFISGGENNEEVE